MSLSRVLRFVRRRDNPISEPAIHTDAASWSLLRLPIELLSQILGYLDDAGLLLVARTCHLLRQLVIRQHDRDEILTDAEWRVCKRLIRKDECYKIVVPPEMVMCTTCLAPHPRFWFSEEQLSVTDPFERVCRARQGQLGLCNHKHTTYEDVQDVRLKYKRHDAYLEICSRAMFDDACGNVYVDYKAGSSLGSGSAWDYNGQTPITIHYYFDSGIFNRAQVHVHDWSLCPHWDLEQVVDYLRIISVTLGSPYHKTCDNCSLRYWTATKGEYSLMIRRDLGHGGAIPDEWWLANLGIAPRPWDEPPTKSKERRKN